MHGACRLVTLRPDGLLHPHLTRLPGSPTARATNRRRRRRRRRPRRARHGERQQQAAHRRHEAHHLRARSALALVPNRALLARATVERPPEPHGRVTPRQGHNVRYEADARRSVAAALARARARTCQLPIFGTSVPIFGTGAYVSTARCCTRARSPWTRPQRSST